MGKYLEVEEAGVNPPKNMRKSKKDILRKRNYEKDEEGELSRRQE